jgi:hypothetical protein
MKNSVLFLHFALKLIKCFTKNHKVNGNAKFCDNCVQDCRKAELLDVYLEKHKAFVFLHVNLPFLFQRTNLLIITTQKPYFFELFYKQIHLVLLDSDKTKREIFFKK